MARTSVTTTDAPGAYSGDTQKVTMEAADTTNKNKVQMVGDEFLLIHNTDGTNSHSVTISSVDDDLGRQEDISSVSIGSGEIHVWGPSDFEGWKQTDGALYFEADNTAIEFGILRQ